MNLKNYTSTVPAINSINRIELKLSQAGATYITKSYEGNVPSGMMFQLLVNGTPLTFKVPAKVDKIFDYMNKQRKQRLTKSGLETLKLQAQRTAWKILADWIDLQISMVQLEQVEPAEVFLPYLYDTFREETFYSLMKKQNFNLLGEGGK